MSYYNKAYDLLVKYEGFTDKATWDVNAYRIGHGSDTITFNNGTFRTVKKGDTTTRANAKKDLIRRLPEFEKKIKRQLGAKCYDKQNDNTKAAIISIAYNYGNVPHKSLRDAICTGNKKTIAHEWIESTKNDNKGEKFYNALKIRRKKEADYILAGKSNYKKPLIAAALIGIGIYIYLKLD